MTSPADISVVFEHPQGFKDVLVAFVRVAALQGEHDRLDGTSRHDYGRQAEQAVYSTQRARLKDKLTWRHLLAELYWATLAQTDDAGLRDHLIHLAALALAWANAIDRRTRNSAPRATTPPASGAPSPAPENHHPPTDRT